MMKPIIKISVFLLLPVILFDISCKKELSCESCKDNNKPPIANAGGDQTTSLPTDSAVLNGSLSFDPEGAIVSYAWTKISGPSPFNISNAQLVQTKVNGLLQGVYQFELKVTDAGGLFSKDTTHVSVNTPTLTNCAQPVPFGTLSFADYGFKTVTAGNKIIFANGWLASKVDIYDTLNQTWSTADVSQNRSNFAVATAGNKVFFAGGDDGSGYGFCHTRVDLYDVSANTWSIAELSQARSIIAAASAGNKVYFGGGWSYDHGLSDLVDVYDVSSNSWSISHLSEARSWLSAVSLNNKIYFAGGTFKAGISNKVDVVDAFTGAWSTTTMAEPKRRMASFVFDNKIIWAGGENMSTVPYASNLADVFDVNTGAHTLHQLSSTTSSAYNNNVARKDNKIMFLTGQNNFKIDTYDITTQTWSVCDTPGQSPVQALTSIGNKVFAAVGWQSGNYTNRVWKLDF